MELFSAFAHRYDKFNTASYDGYTDFINGCFKKSDIPVKEVLDVGCGTGEITLRLAERGYDMVGVDLSAEMLGVLREKQGSDKVLILMQDMCELDLYGTVQGAVCTYDCFNYLCGNSDLDRAFERISLFTEAGGIFVFDINTKHTYESVYADNCYVYEDGGDMLIWQNKYSKSSQSCCFMLTLFEEGEDGYTRRDEVQYQHYFPVNTVKALLDKNGFELMGLYGGINYEEFNSTSNKAYFICKKRR